MKNRSRVIVDGRELLLFPNCVRSLAASIPEGLSCELVVSDWGSDDWPLDDWIHEAAGSIPVRIVPVDGVFSRGRGRNVVAAAARGDVLFFTDTDALFSERVFTRGLEVVSSGQSFFPIRFMFEGPEHATGVWRTWGFGNCMISRDTFERSGGWPDYDYWGREDDEFFAQMNKLSTIVREEAPGFCHQWHPDDIPWKDQHGKLPEALRSLADIVPAGESFVLVDKRGFGVTEIDGRQARQFLEIDGLYVGEPPDEQTAIFELERLRSAGATHIAFGWMAFGWLEHLPGFAGYLQARFPLVHEDEQLKVFEL